METVTDKFLNWDDLLKKDNKAIDWKSNVGFTLLFSINNIIHSAQIIEDLGIIGKNHYVVIKFDNNIIKKMRTDRLGSMQFKKIYFEYSFKYKKGDMVNGFYIETPFVKKRNNYNWNQKYYSCRCLAKGHSVNISEGSIMDAKCPICFNKKIVSGINDINTTDAWMVPFFKNKNEATEYSSHSGHKIVCKCPKCGYEKEMAIEVLHRYGFRCDFCSDKLSFPNKLMTYVLLQLQSKNLIQNFKREYSAEWSENYRYDGYFQINGSEYIIEMDGGFHYLDHTISGKSHRDVKKIDEIKQKLAESHNIKVLRIDCNYHDLSERGQYIIDNMKKSLSKYIDINLIDWDQCVCSANKNLITEICEKYNSGLNRIEICDQYSWLSNSTIGNYLKIGTSCGLCNYDGNYSKIFSRFYLLDNSGNVLETSRTARELIRILKDKYSISVKRNLIYKSLNTSQKLLDLYLLKADKRQEKIK